MKNNKISDNYMDLIIKIIDYLSAEQEKNNTNELIPIIDIRSKSILKDVNEHFNEQIKMWKEYYSYQKLISTELLTEMEEGKIYDGILISDLDLCKKRLINKELGDKNFGCVRVDDTNGIYFEESTIKGKTSDLKEDLIIASTAPYHGPTDEKEREKYLKTLVEGAAEIWKNHNIFEGAILPDNYNIDEKGNENSRKK